MKFLTCFFVCLLLFAPGCLLTHRPTSGQGGCSIEPRVIELSDGSIANRDAIVCNVETPRGPDDPGTFRIVRDGAKVVVTLGTGMGGSTVLGVAAAWAGPWQIVGLVFVVLGVGLFVVRFLPPSPVVTPIRMVIGDLPKNAALWMIVGGVGIAAVPVVLDQYGWIIAIGLILLAPGYYVWEYLKNKSEREKNEANGANGHANGTGNGAPPPDAAPAGPSPVAPIESPVTPP